MKFKSIIFILFLLVLIGLNGRQSAQDIGIIWVHEFRELNLKKDTLAVIGDDLLGFDLKVRCKELFKNKKLAIEMRGHVFIKHELGEELGSMISNTIRIEKIAGDQLTLVILSEYTDHGSRYTITSYIIKPELIGDVLEFPKSNNIFSQTHEVSYKILENGKKEFPANAMEPLAERIAEELHKHFHFTVEKKKYLVYAKKVDILPSPLKDDYKGIPRTILMRLAGNSLVDVQEADSLEKAEYILSVKYNVGFGDATMKVDLKSKLNSEVHELSFDFKPNENESTKNAIEAAIKKLIDEI